MKAKTQLKIFSWIVIILTMYLGYSYDQNYCLPQTGCMSAPYGYTFLTINSLIGLLFCALVIYLEVRK